MTWLRAFLIGLFTRHLGTKLLALLLSVGLFSFVQFSQRDTREIPELDIMVTLDADLQDRFVLLTPRLRLEGVVISGFRQRVDAVARQHLQTPLPVEINERFLRLHREGLDIPVNASFFRDEALWGKDVKVEELPSGRKIELDELVTLTGVLVVIDPDTNRILPKDHPYQGTLEDDALDISVSTNQVTVRGPKRAFGENPRIVLALPNLALALEDFQTTDEQADAPIVDFHVDWRKGNIDVNYVDNLLITEGPLGLQKTARTFQAGLTVTCKVAVRKVQKEVSIPIDVRVGENPEDITKWDSSGRLIMSDAVRARKATDFPLRMPKSLADDKEFLSRLVLILNWANAEKLDDGTLRVPVYLDLKGDRRPQDLERLLRIDIDFEHRWEEFTPK